jgi:hypothetical protein
MNSKLPYFVSFRDGSKQREKAHLEMIGAPAKTTTTQ